MLYPRVGCRRCVGSGREVVPGPEPGSVTNQPCSCLQLLPPELQRLTVEADTDTPMTSAEMARALDLIGTPTVQPDVDLDFDPDGSPIDQHSK